MLTPQQLDRYRAWLDNARRLRELTTELETLTIHAVEQANDGRAKRRTRSAENEVDLCECALYGSPLGGRRLLAPVLYCA